EDGGTNGDGTVYEISSSQTWNFDPPTLTGGSCGTNVMIVAQTPVTTTIPTGLAITETWLITDCCGNLSTCTQTVTVVNSSVVYDISAFAVTNYTGFVLASDTGPNGRQAIRTLTTMSYTNFSAMAQNVDFRLTYQLLDPSGNPVPILDENGQSNTTYSVYEPLQLIRTQHLVLTNG